jgi:hypothetical protein
MNSRARRQAKSRTAGGIRTGHSASASPDGLPRHTPTTARSYFEGVEAGSRLSGSGDPLSCVKFAIAHFFHHTPDT